jgi:uncharacterized membrane protein
MKKRTLLRAMLSLLAVGLVMLVLDMVWLGVIATGLYDNALKELKRPSPYLPAAAAFYGMYAFATWWHGVKGASTVRDAAQRGGSLGFVAYATYELTNWAVIQGWSANIVFVDIAWGLVLTAISSIVGFFVLGAPARSNASELAISSSRHDR